VTAIDVIRNALARVVVVEEAIEVGDTGEAFAILIDLEGDLVGSLAALSMEQEPA
jgi:hypothetical protein